MRAKSTSGMGKEHEEYVVKIFEWDGAQRSRSSGASFHDPTDVSSQNLVVECECTNADSYRLKKDFWKEIVMKTHSGKLPLGAIRFRDESGKHLDLGLMDLNDISEMLETLNAYQTLALEG